MINRTLTITVIIISLFATGCTSVQTMQGANLERLKVGDRVTVTENSGQTSIVVIADITESDISGHYYQTGRAVSIPRSNILSADVERPDYVKSAALGVGGFLILGAIIASAMPFGALFP